MEKTYKLEFNEEQQQFHLAPPTEGPGGPGWVEITDHCTDLEFWIFEAYVNRVPGKRLTHEYLLQSLGELIGFLKNINEYNLVFGFADVYFDMKPHPPFTIRTPFNE